MKWGRFTFPEQQWDRETLSLVDAKTLKETLTSDTQMLALNGSKVDVYTAWDRPQNGGQDQLDRRPT